MCPKKIFYPQHSFIIITIPTPQMNIISETSHDISNDTKKEKAPPTTQLNLGRLMRSKPDKILPTGPNNISMQRTKTTRQHLPRLNNSTPTGVTDNQTTGTLNGPTITVGTVTQITVPAVLQQTVHSYQNLTFISMNKTHFSRKRTHECQNHSSLLSVNRLTSRQLILSCPNSFHNLNKFQLLQDQTDSMTKGPRSQRNWVTLTNMYM